MDPATTMAAISAITTLIGSLTGKGGEQSSPYSKKQKQGLEGIMEDIKGMKGGAQDITQNAGYGQGMDWLMSMFNDPEFFNQFEAPLQRQFQEQTVPDLANRFASMGSGGALGSTGFRNQLAREGSNLSTNIAALRGGMQQQAVPQLLQYAQQPFNNLLQLQNLAYGHPMNTQYQPPSMGATGALSAPFAQGAAQAYANQSNPGQNPSTYQYPLTGGYDQAFRMTGVPMQ